MKAARPRIQFNAKAQRGGAATEVARTSKSAVSRVSKPAASTAAVGLADWEVGDTAGLETCATKSGGHCLEKSSRLVTILTDSSAKNLTADKHGF
jgi:hypothetical protein